MFKLRPFNSIITLLLSLVLVTGCAMRGTPTPTEIPIQLLDQNANSGVPTPTPFLPDLSGFNPVGNLFTPTPVTPEGVSLGLERPVGQVNILLLGSDWRPGQGSRTDVIMLLSLIPDQGTATLTSFPRDLYVNIPGYGYERINVVQAYGGFELMQQTFVEVFDAPVDYYMLTNFTGFTGIIDTLGGITVNAAFGLTDRCDLPQAVEKDCSVPAGRVNMNGETALWYVRSRYTTDDFDRTRRAQEVIIAIAQKTMSLNALSQAGELYQLFRNSVETNLPLDVIVKLLPLASDIMRQPSILQRYAITEKEITHFTVPVTHARVLLPDYDAIAEIIRKALYPGLP
jgi:LCP family protein required for cell wall assembly